MALVNEVGIAEIGVGVGDRGPGCAVAELRLRDGPQRFAAADGVGHCCVRQSARRRHDAGTTMREPTCETAALALGCGART